MKLCKTARIVAALPEPYRGALSEALVTDLPDYDLVKAIRLAGLKLSYSSIYRHRRSLCPCEEKT
jgi:hypothetical protein